jgi:hypothetical protein
VRVRVCTDRGTFGSVLDQEVATLLLEVHVLDLERAAILRRVWREQLEEVVDNPVFLRHEPGPQGHGRKWKDGGSVGMNMIFWAPTSFFAIVGHTISPCAHRETHLFLLRWGPQRTSRPGQSMASRVVRQ